MAWYGVCFVVLLAVSAAHAEDLEDVAEARSLQDLIGGLKLEDITVPLPWDTEATVSSRELQNGVINFNLKFKDADMDVDEEGRGKKKKIKKILIPIAVLLFMKALALIPLILGVLGFKTWNALQLSFITFITSFGMAIYELCKKFAADHPPPIVAHHEHWDAQAQYAHHRSLNVDQVADAQQMAYSGYV